MGKAGGLPDQNEYGCYEIRMESIGGLGANLCAKMLGEAGMESAGLNSAVFSSYGSEKTGTPVRGYVRFCEADREIRLHSPIIRPHLLAVFHEALLAEPLTLAGCVKTTKLLINTVSGKSVLEQHGNGEKRELLNGNPGQVFGIDAGRIGMETKSRVNVVMLGAMAKITGFIRLEDLYEICKKTLGRKYPAALGANLEGIKRGYEEVEALAAYGDGKERAGEKTAGEKTEKEKDRHDRPAKEAPAGNAPAKDLPDWGYATAPIGGMIPHYGNSVVNDLSPSRQGYVPLFIPEKCINCGLCGSACPDMVFQFQKGEYRGREMMINKGLDYYHCKGCMRCVNVCPVQALVSGREERHTDKKYFMPNQELVRTPVYYRKAGPDGYITSESFLTEKRMEGGEV